MIVDWQREPIKDQLIHIDLKRIALDKALRVSVRVKLLGIPVGVKTAGGILDQVLREVEIECLPADIPSHIDVDVSNLEMHGVLRVSGLPHSDKIKYLNSEDATVAHVVSIREEAPTGCRSGRSSGSGGSPPSRRLPRRASRKMRQQVQPQPEPRSPRRQRSNPWPRKRVRTAEEPFLVVGLGNPGLEYLWTPHNAGFMAIDRIAQQEGVVVQNRRCRAVTATCRMAGREVVLAKPETFMNLSGLAVAALVREFEADPAQDLLVIHDELDLTLGTLQDQGARFAGRAQRSPQRNRRSGNSGVVAHSHWRGARICHPKPLRPEAAGGPAGIICSRPCARRI